MTERVRLLLTGAFVVAGSELKRLTRSRGAMIMTFLSPVAISTIVVFALGSTDDIEPSVIGWVTESDDPAADIFIEGVVERPELDEIVDWHQVASVAVARSELSDENLGAVIVIGPSATPGGAPTLEVLGEEDPLASGVAATIVDEFQVIFATASLAAERGLELPEIESTELVLTAPGGRSLDASVHWGPALGAFLVLLAMGHAAHRQVDDRQRGTGARMASTVTPRSAMVIGRSMAATATGAAALLVMALSSQLMFGRAWGRADTILLVVFATALAVAGVGAAIAGFARTPGQAQTLTAVISFALAIGGGSFQPLNSAVEAGAFTRWLPTSLSLDAFSIAATNGDLADLALPVIALAATGITLFAGAAVMQRGMRSA